MLIISVLSKIFSTTLSLYLFFVGLHLNFIPSYQNFTINELPFLVTINPQNVSKNPQIEEKESTESKKKNQKKKWDFTDSQPNIQNSSQQQPYIQQMKSTIENSSSAIKGTAENSTLLKVYLNQNNN